MGTKVRLDLLNTLHTLSSSHTSTQPPSIKVDSSSTGTLPETGEGCQRGGPTLLFLLIAGASGIPGPQRIEPALALGFFLGMSPKAAVRKVAHLVPWSWWKDSSA